MSAARLLVRSVLLVWSLSAATKAPAACPVSSPSLQQPTAVTMLPEVRLRKVHLVRLDLIPYPIAYEVFC